MTRIAPNLRTCLRLLKLAPLSLATEPVGARTRSSVRSNASGRSSSAAGSRVLRIREAFAADAYSGLPLPPVSESMLLHHPLLPFRSSPRDRMKQRASQAKRKDQRNAEPEQLPAPRLGGVSALGFGVARMMRLEPSLFGSARILIRYFFHDSLSDLVIDRGKDHPRQQRSAGPSPEDHR